MPFLFEWLCELLDELQDNSHRRTLTSNRAQNHENQTIYNWYSRFSNKIERTGPAAVAFLSCLLPERRPDRVYNIQVKRLSRIFGRALGLGASRALQLNQWCERDGADLPTSIELTLKECENDKPIGGREVSLEEIDEAFDLIAAHSISSSAAIRTKATEATPTDLLAPILRRLQSNEAKWLARMLLKNYSPVQLPEREILRGFHFMLPNLLDLQNSFDAAITTLANPEIRHLPPRPDKNYERALQNLVSQCVQPQLGVMIKRQPYHKARSIKHCCTMAKGRVMSVERKYDGEYCQVHIDMSMEHDCVQIFSKSGRNSTTDRVRLHTVIKDALRIGRNGCRIREKCIVEGELLVWNDLNKCIQPFHTIRKYVKHGGRDIGTARDSPKKSEESLMIAFYDILVLDNRMLLNKSNKIRRQYLKSVLQTTEGRAILGERRIIDFTDSQSAGDLRAFFATAISRRWEGLVLKGLDDPYFCWNHQNHSIKLKKDYITSLGNTADLCIVGARRDPHIEQQIGHGRLKWTTFYIGALHNLEEVRRFAEKPNIKVIDTLTQHSMPIAELLDLGQIGKLYEVEYALEIAEFKVEMCRSDIPPPDVLFKKPFVVEIMGAGFDKPSNASFFTLRFPRKVNGKIKLHTDRTFLDTTSFQQLQYLASQSLAVAVDEDLLEDAEWIKKLIQADGTNRCDDSVPRDHTPLRTPVRIPTGSLSALDSSLGSATPIFVRSDTVEPECRNIIRDGCLTNTTKATDRPFTSQELACTALEHMSNTEPQKTITSKFIERHSETGSNKRQYLTDIQNCSRRRTESVSTTGVKSPSSMPTRMESLAREGAVHSGSKSFSKESSVNAFDPPAEFYSPRSVKRKRRDTSEASPQINSHPTPDSTVVMRQILSMPDRPNNALRETSPSESPTNNTSRRSLTRLPPKSGLAASNKPALLPTPPASSPSGQNKHIKILYPTKGMCEPFSKGLVSEPVEDNDQQAQNNKSGDDDHEEHNERTANNLLLAEAEEPVTNGHQVKVKEKDEDIREHKVGNGQTVTDRASSRQNNDIAVIRNTLQPANLNLEAPTSKPIFIARTPTWPQAADTILNLERSTFTYNIAYFLDCVKASSNRADTHPYHIAFTSSADHFQFAHVLFTTFAFHVHHRLLATNSLTISDDIQPYSNQVLLFDINVLTKPIFNDGIVTLDKLRSLDYRNGHGEDAALFFGFVRLFVRDLKEGVRVDLKYDLSWTS